jgi:NADH-quinone oxidoreductase subunit G
MPAFPGLDFSFADIEQSDAIILIGSNIQKEQPIASLRVRKAALKGAAIIVINPVDYTFNFNVTAKKIIAPHLLIDALADMNAGDMATHPLLAHLNGKQKIYVLLGASAIHHPQATRVRALAQKIAQRCNAKLGYLTTGANSAGAWLAGAVPHRHAGQHAMNHTGLNASDMVHKPRKAYVLLNVEPELDCANAHVAVAAIKQAQCVIALSLFRNSVLEQHADLILPMAPFTETSGTFVNAIGEWQSFKGVASAYGSSRPAWKILRVLGNFLHLEGFDYESSEQVKHEVQASLATASAEMTSPEVKDITPRANSISRIGDIPLYASDSLVRRALPLQKAQMLMDGDLACVRMHPETASRLHLADGDTVKVKQQGGETTLPLYIDQHIALDAAWIPGGIPATNMLGDLFGEVEIQKH